MPHHERHASLVGALHVQLVAGHRDRAVVLHPGWGSEVSEMPRAGSNHPSQRLAGTTPGHEPIDLEESAITSIHGV